MRALNIFLLLCLLAIKVSAQDAVIIREGEVVRGLIKGTDYNIVALQPDDGLIQTYEAKNIDSFVWNGETYVSRPFLVKKKLAVRFFKVVESGSINLYSMGDKQQAPAAPVREKVRPGFGVNIGTGGFGGMGGSISIGGGGAQRPPENAGLQRSGKLSYFLEKPGTGPMVEVQLENQSAVKSLLLQKLNDDEDLVSRIKDSDSFSEAGLLAFIKSYNVAKSGTQKH